MRIPPGEVNEAEQDDEIESISSQDKEEEVIEEMKDENYNSDSGDGGKPLKRTASEEDRYHIKWRIE